MTTYTFELPDLALERGGRLAPARLVYSIFGELSATRDNAILFPTAFGGRRVDNEWLIGPGEPLDTNRYYVVVPSLLGSGESSSPSNHQEPFPLVSVRDNVHLQKRLVDELGIVQLELVVGYSMGGQQAYEWAATHPQQVRRLACLCSAARTSSWQTVFLRGMRAVLELHDPAVGVPAEARITEALARVWAPWGLSDVFYDEAGYRELGHDDQGAFVEAYWVNRLSSFHVADLAAMLDTWSSHDLGDRTTPEPVDQVLSRITCPTLLMPSRTDQYFRAGYAARECEMLPNAVMEELNSTWGHVAGRGISEGDAASIRAALRAHLKVEVTL